MKNPIFLIIVFVLASCTSTPQVTVTSEVTVTLTSPAPEATSTPEPTTANDGAGAWVEAESPAMQQTTALLEQYSIDPETVTVTEKDGTVTVTDNETEKVLMISTEEGTRYDLGFAVDQIAAKSCESKPEFTPRPKDGLVPADFPKSFDNYFYELRRELSYYGGANFYPSVLIDRERRCWGKIGDGWNLIYRNENGEGVKVDLIPKTKEEVEAFVRDR